jgi:predicted nucleotidyltransferase component of viral defense system
MTSAISVKDRLKNQAAAYGKTLQELLVVYGLERTIYRVAVSEYAERFTLKGGIFLYAFFEGEFARATRDIDFLAKNISHNAEEIKTVFENIFSISCDDALRYDLNTLEVKNITEFKEYHGVNISIMAYLDRTRIPVSIDIGFGDVVYPNRVKMEFPVLLDMNVPEIYAYSIASVIAEKFEAIVSLGDANSRYKDFYDLYILAAQCDLCGTELREAVRETFKRRETGYDEIFAFSDGFITSEIHQNRWKAFLRKKKALLNVDLAEVVALLRSLLLPIVDSIIGDKEFVAAWNHESQRWEEIKNETVNPLES